MFKLLIIIGLLLSTRGFCDNKIVYLVAMPRSSSTAFMRMMQNRGDFQIMHEPLVYAFGMTFSPEFSSGWYNEKAIKTDKEVFDTIVDRSKHSNVFVKEMSFFLTPFLKDHLDFVKNPNVHFAFLIRNPHPSSLSQYKQLQTVMDYVDDYIGTRAAYQVYEVVKAHSPNKPVIVFSEDVYANPTETIRKFCNELQLSFDEKHLSWSALGDEFTGKEEWNDMKLPEKVQQWHWDVIHSTSFHKPNEYKIDSKGKPTFEEVTNPEHRKRLIAAYEENLIYYNKFKQLN